MLEVKYEHDHYEAEFESFAAHRALEREPAWLLQLRKEALEFFGERGFPTTRDEEWKYTSVAAIARTPFRLAESAPLSSRELAAAGIDLWDGPQAIFVNGFFAPDLSSLAGLPAGVKVGALSHALRDQPGLVERELMRPFVESHGFTALNAAFMTDGGFVHLGRKAVADKPIHLVFVRVAAAYPTVSNVRSLIIAEELSQGSVVETYITVGPGNPGVLTNAATQVSVAESAVVDHYRVQREGPDAQHISSQQAYLGRDAAFSTHTYTLGGALVRNDVAAVLDGEGADCRLDGLYVASDHQRVDNRTLIEHAKPHCTSNEVYKGVVDDMAHGTFNGIIVVRPGAIKSDARQTNQNLQLSRDAVINTKPQLEIYNDDVKCAHGATIGQLDDNALFYLRSRGIGIEEARALLTYAFASELVDQAKVPAVRAAVSEFLLERMDSAGFAIAHGSPHTDGAGGRAATDVDFAGHKEVEV